jgi:hypothetical protein
VSTPRSNSGLTHEVEKFGIIKICDVTLVLCSYMQGAKPHVMHYLSLCLSEPYKVELEQHCLTLSLFFSVILSCGLARFASSSSGNPLNTRLVC